MAFVDYRFCWLVVCLSAWRVGGFYLISDYYLDQSHSRLFGGICGKEIDDACAYINSHINNLFISKYGSNRDCQMRADAGKMGGALYRFETVHFKLQPANEAGDCVNDYVEFYDGPAMNASDLFGRFCGSQEPNFTGFPTQRYVYINFQTDGSGSDTGIRFRAIRSEPFPCQDNEYHCRHENRCIDGRLRCDGTDQCVTGQDEGECTGWEKFVGFWLRLGLGGLMGVGIGVFVGCVVIATIICCCTCCRKKTKASKVHPFDDSESGRRAETKTEPETDKDADKKESTDDETSSENKETVDEFNTEVPGMVGPIAGAAKAEQKGDRTDGGRTSQLGQPRGQSGFGRKKEADGQTENGMAKGTGGKEGMSGKEGTDGKEGTGGKEGTDGKERTGGKEGISGKEGTDGKEGTGGKEGRDGKEGRGGKEGTDRKEGTEGKEGKEGKESTDGKEGTRGAREQEGTDGMKGICGEEGTNGKEELASNNEIGNSTGVNEKKESVELKVTGVKNCAEDEKGTAVKTGQGYQKGKDMENGMKGMKTLTGKHDGNTPNKGTVNNQGSTKTLEGTNKDDSLRKDCRVQEDTGKVADAGMTSANTDAPTETGSNGKGSNGRKHDTQQSKATGKAPSGTLPKAE